MNWLLKVAAFDLLSILPAGPAVYRYSQRHITRSTVPTADRIRQKISVGLQYWNWLAANGGTGDVAQLSHLDFGAGWFPTIPLLCYSLGVNHQHLFDVQPLLETTAIDDTVQLFRQVVTDPDWPHRSILRRLPEFDASTGSSPAGYLKPMGISYLAPYDHAFDDLRESTDFATCTQVFCYMRRAELRLRLRQIQQCLRPQGRFLATVHLKDMYSAPGHGHSKYNYLKFSNLVWDRCINSSLQSYNRLKARDYRELLEEAGFRIVHWDVEGPTADDLEELARIPIHKCFERYTMEELGAKHLFFVAEKGA